MTGLFQRDTGLDKRKAGEDSERLTERFWGENEGFAAGTLAFSTLLVVPTA